MPMMQWRDRQPGQHRRGPACAWWTSPRTDGASRLLLECGSSFDLAGAELYDGISILPSESAGLDCRTGESVKK